MDHHLRLSPLSPQHSALPHIQPSAHNRQAPAPSQPDQLDPSEMLVRAGGSTSSCLQRQHSLGLSHDWRDSLHRRGCHTQSRQGEPLET